jgi:hypothetical protein
MESMETMRPRTATAVLETRGAFIAHPDRERPKDWTILPRMTCDGRGAKLCHTSDGELEQIQFLLGHASRQLHPMADYF